MSGLEHHLALQFVSRKSSISLCSFALSTHCTLKESLLCHISWSVFASYKRFIKNMTTLTVERLTTRQLPCLFHATTPTNCLWSALHRKTSPCLVLRTCFFPHGLMRWIIIQAAYRSSYMSPHWALVSPDLNTVWEDFIIETSAVMRTCVSEVFPPCQEK